MIFDRNQTFSLLTGLIIGKRVKTDKNNNVNNAATVNTKPIKTSKYATIGITAPKKKLDSRAAQTVQMNILCTGVNIGVSAFVAKITWDSYLTYTGVDFGDFGSNLSIDDSLALTQRTLLVLGQNTTNMDINDFILFKINFNMSTVPDNVDFVNVNCIKTTGTTMTDCSLLTLKDGNLYYITPIESNNGYFYFDSEDKPVEPVPDIVIPGPSNFPTGGSGGTGGGGQAPSGGSSSGDYNLNGYLGGAGGSGAYIVVEIWQGGVLIGSDRQWVTSGNFNIGGSIDISNPTPGYGDVSIKIKVEPAEDDDTPYYVLIPAGGFNIVFTTVVAKEDKTYPKEPLIVQYVESLELLDLYDMDIYSNAPVDLDANIDEITLIDDYVYDTISINILENDKVDEIGILDDYALDIESVPVPVDLDGNLDTVELTDVYVKDTVTIIKYDNDTLEELGLTDINDNVYITVIITDVLEQDTVTVSDVYSID